MLPSAGIPQPQTRDPTVSHQPGLALALRAVSQRPELTQGAVARRVCACACACACARGAERRERSDPGPGASFLRAQRASGTHLRDHGRRGGAGRDLGALTGRTADADLRASSSALRCRLEGTRAQREKLARCASGKGAWGAPRGRGRKRSSRPRLFQAEISSFPPHFLFATNAGAGQPRGRVRGRQRPLAVHANRCARAPERPRAGAGPLASARRTPGAGAGPPLNPRSSGSSDSEIQSAI